MPNHFVSTRKHLFPVSRKLNNFQTKKQPLQSLLLETHTTTHKPNSKNRTKMVVKGGNITAQQNPLPKSSGQFSVVGKAKVKPIRFML
jgi:hypothetical protein